MSNQMSKADWILSKLIVIDNFASKAECKMLVDAYRSVMPFENMGIHSDNKVDLSPGCEVIKKNPYAKYVAVDILLRTRDKINELYHTTTVHVDMGGLFGRIPGNICDFHADNIMKVCPTHGINQNLLRDVDCQCPQAKYAPNHTAYREYTGLLYLDSNHKGGDIIFQDEIFRHPTYRKQIEAIEGRLVLSPNSQYYYHETSMVTEGIRYSMNMWFTSDKFVVPIMP